MANEKDDFWDIASLLPQRKKKSAPVFAETVETAAVETRETSSPRMEADAGKLHFFDTKEGGKAYSYQPCGNPFLRGVTVHTYPSNYRFYRAFREDAVRLFAQEGEECAYFPFFSYIPQYAQLRPSQLAYYLYFRSEARKGRYIDIDPSYFWLYVYEILNLPDLIPPEEGITLLANIWAAYREKMPSIEKNMVRWLADYALIHGVACPNQVLEAFLPHFLPLSHLKEFYLGKDADFTECRLHALLALSSDYAYRSSRYFEENRALMLAHIPTAAALVLNCLLQEKSGGVLEQTVTKRYEAYQGALCAQEEKYEIEVTYCSVSGTESLKQIMTAAVKYAENKVRAHLSIKSRLAVSALPQKYKQLIDGYFEKALPKKKKAELAPTIRPEYEELYDAPSRGFSDEEAQKIENDSWQNTLRLVSDEEKDELMRAEPVFSKTVEEVRAPAVEEDALDGVAVGFLDLLFHSGEKRAKAYCAEKGVLAESLCEKINEYFMDLLGDIIIEIGVGQFALLEDYETEVEEFLNSRTRNE